MKAGEFCERAGVKSYMLRLLRRSGSLPFEELRECGKHPSFTEKQLKAMLLAREISEVGVPMSAACRIVRRDPECAARILAAVQ